MEQFFIVYFALVNFTGDCENEWNKKAEFNATFGM